MKQTPNLSKLIILACFIIAGLSQTSFAETSKKATLANTAENSSKTPLEQTSQEAPPQKETAEERRKRIALLDYAYKLGPDSTRQPGVPKGRITYFTFRSRIFPETIRDYAVYVPSQYNEEKPAALIVFQDGVRWYLKADGQFRAPIVLDNLIHKNEIPVMIAIFINPGSKIESGKTGSHEKNNFSNRSLEYDSLNDKYARFLSEELIPSVGQRYNISSDPFERALCGISSGAVASLTAAWEKPNHFRKVLCHVGSFVNIRKAHNYPAIIRQRKPHLPLRIFLQAGANDLDNHFGNWPLANKQMEAALKFAGYDHQFVFGEGKHSGRHGGAILPDSIRWLWREHRMRQTTDQEQEEK